MENCDKVNLLKLQGQYLGFIIQEQTELEILDHIANCEECRQEIIDAVKNEEPLPDYGNLFQRDLANPTVPKFSDYDETENFIDARIQWRRNKVKELMEEAEIELKDLETRLEP